MENPAPVLIQDIMWTTVILQQVNCLMTKGKSSGNSALYCTRICSGDIMSPCIRIGAGTCGKSCTSSDTGYNVDNSYPAAGQLSDD